MKIYFRSRHGAEFRLETKLHEPISYDQLCFKRFCILASLAVCAMILVTALLWEVWR